MQRFPRKHKVFIRDSRTPDNLPALRQNFQQVACRVGTSIILAVVKANAYGHGAVRVSQISTPPRTTVTRSSTDRSAGGRG